MALNLVEMVSRQLTAPKRSTTSVVRPYSGNPFGSEGFYTNTRPAENSSYMKNTPIKGGYFAGYHNGKANIVGQRLFIEA